MVERVESQSQFKIILNNLSESLMILSKDKIQLANKMFHQQFGHSIKGMESSDDVDEFFVEENTIPSKFKNCLLNAAKKVQRVLAPRSRRYEDP